MNEELAGWQQRVVVKGSMSRQRSVMSSAPQGLVLGPQLFNFFVGNIDSGVECMLSKSDDNTMLCIVIGTLEERDDIQRELYRLERCAGEVQQSQVQVPAPGSGHSQTQLQVSWRLD